jgi:hypothetical protein
MMLISILRGAALITAALLIGVLPAVAQTSPIEASTSPTSIGFEDPDDTSNLLEYRLPDWGYRIWDLAFDLGGSGADNYLGDDNQTIANRFNGRLGTEFSLYRESEKRDWRTSASAVGSYLRHHQGSNTIEASGHTFNSSLSAGGDLKEYLGEGPFFFGVGGSVSHRYEEQIVERRRPEGALDSQDYARSFWVAARAGLGVGRVRDVTPLIRAQRLSERLVALGRAPLTANQVLDVASVLATEQGYRMVFDRPDRSFWRDTLEPLLDPDNSLSPYEVFYLRDVMNEDIGTRTQGASIEATAVFNERRSSYGEDEYNTPWRSAGLVANWSHNLNLNHQLRALGSVMLSSGSGGSRRSENVVGRVELEHLWAIADRYRWDNSLGFRSNYVDVESTVDQAVYRYYETSFDSRFRIFVEDRMAVLASVNVENRQGYGDIWTMVPNQEYERRWQWTYGVGLEYTLDTFLY